MVIATARPAAAPARRLPWRGIALALICAGAGALYAANLGVSGFGNTYYAASVRSMLQSPANFLFGSFDPYGVVTLDKPPMGQWPQALSALVFGYHGWALLLPQVLEGIGTVFLLHRTVRLWAGDNAALLAALIFALTPVTVAISGDNLPDTLLNLWVVAAAYAVTRAVLDGSARRRTGWLALCALFVGCGFLTKMLQAWIVVPALAAAYLAGSRSPVRRKLLDLLIAGAVLAVSSFWWVALHDWWPGTKPYVGGSTDGTAWDLVFGYNGFGRLFGDEAGGASAGVAGGIGSVASGGERGWGRMFGDGVGDQISWLLPFSIFVLAAVLVGGLTRRGGDRGRRAGWVLWGGWLVVTCAVYSLAKGIWHPYYTTMLAPAIAAVSGAGLIHFRRRLRDGDGPAWLLPLGLAVTAAWAFVLAGRAGSWNAWERWVAVAAAALAIVAFLVSRTGPVALALGVFAMLIAPAAWSVGTAAHPQALAALPAAGPPGAGLGPLRKMLPASGGTHGLAGPGSAFSDELSDEQRRILGYAASHRGDAAITLAVDSPGMVMATFIVGSGETVIGMGGYGGTDPVPTAGQLDDWVATGKLKFVLAGPPSTGPALGNRSANAPRQRWLTGHCALVDPAAYGGTAATRPSSPLQSGNSLFTCHA